MNSPFSIPSMSADLDETGIHKNTLPASFDSERVVYMGLHETL